MNKYLIYLLLVFCTLQQIHAQEGSAVVALSLPVRNSLKFNRYAINPTFSFVREQHKIISFTNKKQWVQFNDAPQTYLFSYSGRFKENIGAGIGLFQQDFGVLTTFGGILNFAYNVNIGNENNLTFGLNLGAYQSGINQGRVIVNTPDQTLQNIPSSFLLTVNSGINYGTDFLDFGVSINNLVLYDISNSKIIEENPEQAVQGHIMYTGYMNSRGFFDESKFSTLIRSEFKKDQTVLSGLVMLTVPKGIWAQLGYNSLYGASAGIGLNITNNIALEYNYEQSMGNLSEFGNSHEVTLAYRFKNRYRFNYGDDDEEQSVFNSRHKKVKANTISKSDAEIMAQRRLKIAAQRKAATEAKKVETPTANKPQNELNNKIENKSKEETKLNLEAEPAKAKLEAQAKAEETARLQQIEKAKADAVAKKQLEETERLKREAATRLKLEAEAEAQAKQEAEAAKAKLEAQAKAEETTRLQQIEKAKADAAAKKQLEETERLKREDATRIKLEAEAQAKQEAELAKAKLEAQAKAEETARLQQIEKAKADAAAKKQLEETERLKREEATRIKLEAEAQAKQEAEAAKAKLEAQAKAEETARLQQIEKAKADAAAKKHLEETERLKREEATRIKLEAEAQAKQEVEAAKAKLEAQAKAEETARLQQIEKAKADAAAKKQLEEAERLKREEATRIKLEAEAQAKQEAEAAKAKLEAQAKAEETARLQQIEKAKADVATKKQLEEAERIAKEKEIPEANDEIAQSMKNLTKSSIEGSRAQQELLNDLSEKIANKQTDLDDLKKENDLSEQGVYQAPKQFKSITAENAALKKVQDDIDKNIEEQNVKIIELETLYITRKRKVRDKKDPVNAFYLKTIERLKSEQLQALSAKRDLDIALSNIKVATDFERKRRISRAAYDNQQDRYVKDKKALARIKKFTDESATPLREEDFDFGEEQTRNIQIVKDVINEESGYYMVVAVHSDIEKRDEFVAKVVASGEKNINFFFDVNTNKYFIYYEKFDSISEAKNALELKGSKPYNGKMSLVKIEN